MIIVLHYLAITQPGTHIAVVAGNATELKRMYKEFADAVVPLLTQGTKFTDGIMQFIYPNGSKIDFKVYNNTDDTRGILRDVLYHEVGEVAPNVLEQLYRRTKRLIINDNQKSE